MNTLIENRALRFSLDNSRIAFNLAMAALRKYGKHLPDCKFKEWECSQPDCGQTHTNPCTCGLDCTIARLS